MKNNHYYPRGKKDYYQKYVYYDYHKRRRQIKHISYKAALNNLKRLEPKYNQYLETKEKLKLMDMYMEKYREDCPEDFENILN